MIFIPKSTWLPCPWQIETTPASLSDAMHQQRAAIAARCGRFMTLAGKRAAGLWLATHSRAHSPLKLPEIF